MIEALKSPKEKNLEHKKWLESLPEDERKWHEEQDEYIEENDRQWEKKMEEYEILRKKYSKIIIEDAVEQGINCSYDLILPEEAEILLPYSFYTCPLRITAAYVHENIRVCTKETFHETDDILQTNPVYKKENGLMINTHLGILLYADNDLEDVIVPDGVIEIAPYAFSGCNMKSIKLPETLEKIGKSCFTSCPNLETCILPSSLKKIEDYAFFDCKKLKQVDYKDSIELGYEVFDTCELLKGKVPPVKYNHD